LETLENGHERNVALEEFDNIFKWFGDQTEALHNKLSRFLKLKHT
jgi:hypothetical protein